MDKQEIIDDGVHQEAASLREEYEADFFVYDDETRLDESTLHDVRCDCFGSRPRKEVK